MPDDSPTARALMALELISSRPGVSADRLADRLGVSERAARRYVAMLREAGLPIESVRGPYGGYRVGRGLRLPPLMFTPTEALALVMAVVEAHGAPDPAHTDDPVASAVGKLTRVLPEAVARPFEAVRAVTARRTDPDPPDPAVAAALVQACGEQRGVRIGYDRGRGAREIDVDPWAVVVRHGRWYLLCWSHHAAARRALRIDRVRGVEVLARPFTPPDDLDPMRDLEDQLSMAWPLATEVEIDAPVGHVRSWLPRSMGRLTALDERRTLLVGSTEVPRWYAGQLAALEAPFRVVAGVEIQQAVADVAANLRDAVVATE